MNDLLDAATLASGLALLIGAVAWGFWVWAIFGPTSPDEVKLRVEVLADPTSPLPMTAPPPDTESRATWASSARSMFERTRIASWLSAANEAHLLSLLAPLPPVRPIDVLHVWARAEDVARSLTRKV